MQKSKFTILLTAGIAAIVYFTPVINAQQQQTNANAPTIQQQIKRDLAGRTLVEPTHKRYREKFEVKSVDNVLSVEITGRNNRGTEITYQTQLRLTDHINTYIATADITYKWDGKIWVIQYLQSKSLDIAATGKYRNCILVKTEPVWFAERLFFYNNCDVTLLVEGRRFSWVPNGSKMEWVDFAIPVPANGKAEFYYDTTVEYQIQRVERP